MLRGNIFTNMDNDQLKQIFKRGNSGSKAARIARNRNGHAAHAPEEATTFSNEQALEIAFGWDHGYHQEILSGIDVQRGVGDISTLVTNALPKSRPRRTRRAQEWMQMDDLLYDLIDTKRTFTIAGFHLQIKPDRVADASEINESQMAKNQTQADEFSLATSFFGIVFDLLTDWFITDSCVLSWKVSDQNATAKTPDSIDSIPRKIQSVVPGLDYIGTIDPSDVDWRNSLGVNRLFVRVPAELERRILDTLNRYSLNKATAIEELLNSGIPQKWIDAVINYVSYANPEFDGPMVELKNEDGEYWIIKTKGRKNYGLCSPSMYTIFLPLETRRMFSDGEFAGAYMTKHFIQHVTTGESITSGQSAGSTKNWAKKEDVDALMGHFRNCQKATRMVTNHTVNIAWLYPPVEMFSADKYISCERKIFRWAGVNPAIIGGEKQTTAEAFVGIKKMIGDMWLARSNMSCMVQEFFRHPSIQVRSGVPEIYDIVAQFDENILKDPRQLLDEVKFLIQEGMGDPETVLRELGRDPESVKLSKVRSIEQNKKFKVYEPVWNSRMAGKIPADGADGGTEGGQPPNKETLQNEESRFQTRTSRDTAK